MTAFRIREADLGRDHAAFLSFALGSQRHEHADYGIQLGKNLRSCRARPRDSMRGRLGGAHGHDREDFRR
ncbi:MAG TPA: hypothetical protein VMH86_11525 [Rhizomicrobium sp.]|nr:hypothetical protein [Rhizomicrobium sp.]